MNYSSLLLITPCPYEPISVDEAMLHCRVDSDTEYSYVQALVIAAREYVEAESWRALMPRVMEMRMDGWPSNRVIELPSPPLHSVTSVTYVDINNAVATYDAANYVVDTGSEPGRLALKSAASWPSAELAPIGSVRIRYVAGVADVLTGSSTQEQITAVRNTVSERHKAAIKLIVGHLYENREQVMAGAGLSATQLPMGVSALLMSDRAFRF
jgi:uncharacterized phiE125 gp8 family phage protein